MKNPFKYFARSRDKFYGSILKSEPLIVYTSIGYPNPTQYVRQIAARTGKDPALYIIFMSWFFQSHAHGEAIMRDFKIFQNENPHIRLVMAGNDPSEVNAFRQYEQEAWQLNHNLTVSEDIFYPQPDKIKQYDAIYNARLSREKHIELAFDIHSMAYITAGFSKQDEIYAKKLISEIHGRSPRHSILNAYENEKFVKLTPSEINNALNSASVGLCLSPIEGAMFSSIEYLLAGIPVASVKNLGGRDWYFDDDYTIICEPNKEAILNAVQKLKEREIDPLYIREKTLQKIYADRIQFIKLINSFLLDNKYEPLPSTGWPFRDQISLVGSTKLPNSSLSKISIFP